MKKKLKITALWLGLLGASLAVTGLLYIVIKKNGPNTNKFYYNNF